jgi:hypothetical protein
MATWMDVLAGRLASTPALLSANWTMRFLCQRHIGGPWRPFTVVLDNVNLFEANAAFTFDWHQKWQSGL